MKFKKKYAIFNYCDLNMLNRDFYKERKKREEERKKAIMNLGKKSPKGMHQTNEQRNYQLKVKDLRSKWKKPSGDGNESDSGGEPPGIEKDRQPRLVGLTSDYDLKLFMEAQALASEKIVSLFYFRCHHSVFYLFRKFIPQKNGRLLIFIAFLN